VEACHRLSQEGWAEVQRIAYAISRDRRYYDPDELLHEVIVRTANGKRRCPRNLELRDYLILSMKFLMRDAYRDKKRETSFRKRLYEDPSPILYWEDILKKPDDQILLKEVIKDVLRYFEDIPDAQRMLVGMMEGRHGEELGLALGAVEYASLRRKVLRRLEKAWIDMNSRRKLK